MNIYKNGVLINLEDFFDTLLLTDKEDECHMGHNEWDVVRWRIENDLQLLDELGEIDQEYLERIVFIGSFEVMLRIKLIKAGFDEHFLKNPEELNRVISVLKDQGISYAFHRHEIDFPGFPTGSFSVDEDNRLLWLKPDIEAALRALGLIAIIKGLLVKDGFINKDACKVYLRSMELIISIVRASKTPKLAVSEMEKKDKSLETRNLKKLVMRSLIENIFKKNPRRPKTLGEVWNKLSSGKERIRLEGTNEDFNAKTGKNKKGEEMVIIHGDLHKPFKYAKRSLQAFIDEIKDTNSVTQ